MSRPMIAVVVLVLALAPYAVSGPETALTGKYATEHFDVRYRPGSRAGAAVERDGAMAERDLADMCRQLEFTPEGRFRMFLYDDVPELQLITGAKAGGFTSGRDTHVPQGNDQTRYHEIAHLVTACLPKTGDEERNMFFPDGMANALLTYVHGVHVHAVTKFHRGRGELPKLAKLVRGDFYAWQHDHPRISGYDIGGSFFRFLLDTYGTEKTKRYYGGTPADIAFKKSESELEKAWYRTLDGFELRPEVEIFLKRRAGESVLFTEYSADPDQIIPAEILGKEKDWRVLTGEKLTVEGEGATWKRVGDAIVGSGTKGWNICELGTRKYGNCAIRAKVATEGIYGGIQIRLGAACCGMLVGNGTFVYVNDRCSSWTPKEKVRPSGKVDLMVIRRGDRLEVWVDGHRMVEAPVDASPHPVGIGFHSGPSTGTARFENLRVRALN